LSAGDYAFHAVNLESLVKNIRHFTSDRCPVTKLTKLQVYVLANVCIGMSTDKNIPNGVYRSLIIRGLLTNTHRLTADGCELLANCQILSDQFRRTLLAMPYIASTRGGVLLSP
jgi:hypothetical protein